MRFRFLIALTLALIPVLASATPPIEVEEENWHGKLPVPDGFCTPDVTNAMDKALLDSLQTPAKRGLVQMALLYDCHELRAFREDGHPPHHVLVYNVYKEDALPPVFRPLSRHDFIDALTVQLPAFNSTPQLTTQRDREKLEKWEREGGYHPWIPDVSLIEKSENAFYIAVMKPFPALPTGKPLSIVTIIAETKIGTRAFTVVLSRPYDTDRIFTTLLAENKAITKEFLDLNP